jgi:imidazoleglycerol phosphate synthase glutamine amidotransferase subunit HisH
MASNNIELVDIGGGNLGSIKRCLERLNVRFRIADEGSLPTGEHPLIAPGVGAFGPVMSHLQKAKLDQRLIAVAKSGAPFLGICVGLQILFEGSEEAKGVPGLGLLPGQIVRFTEGKVPQIGWNQILKAVHGKPIRNENWQMPINRLDSPLVNAGEPASPKSVTSGLTLTADELSSGYVYFVNSYYPKPAIEEHVLFYANYYVHFCAAVQWQNITAFQFHPEKSGKYGQQLLERWLADAG